MCICVCMYINVCMMYHTHHTHTYIHVHTHTHSGSERSKQTLKSCRKFNPEQKISHKQCIEKRSLKKLALRNL